MKKRGIKKSQLTIRLEKEFMEFLKAEAKKQNRSMNNYIETTLSKGKKQ